MMDQHMSDGGAPTPRDEMSPTGGRLLRFLGTGWGRVVQGASLLLLAALLFGILVLVVSGSMERTTRDRIITVDELAAVEPYDCILVLGAGVRADGSPSPMLYDRLVTACAVYEALGDVPLLMSGDHTGNYNEVGVMKDQAMELGVPGEDVFLDHAGYSTYESLYRAREVYGAKRVVIVTQSYHLHRALHIARELGIDAVGVASDLRPYRSQTRYELREKLARFKDLFTAARNDHPAITDLPVDLDGDGNET